MLNKIKKLVKHNEPDIILVIGVILIALISFGAGRLTVPKSTSNSIIFNDSSTSSGLSAPASVSNTAIQEQGTDKQVFEGKFVGSKNSDKYHWPDCQWAKRIAEENKIWFNSEEEAQKAGYIRCGNFEKNIP